MIEKNLSVYYPALLECKHKDMHSAYIINEYSESLTVNKDFYIWYQHFIYVLDYNS